MGESSIFGVTVRAWLAVGTVFSGLLFLYLVGYTDVEGETQTVVTTAVISFITLALGYYLGQKAPSPGDTTEVSLTNDPPATTVTVSPPTGNPPPPPPPDKG